MLYGTILFIQMYIATYVESYFLRHVVTTNISMALKINLLIKGDMQLNMRNQAWVCPQNTPVYEYVSSFVHMLYMWICKFCKIWNCKYCILQLMKSYWSVKSNT